MTMSNGSRDAVGTCTLVSGDVSMRNPEVLSPLQAIGFVSAGDPAVPGGAGIPIRLPNKIEAADG